MLNTVKLLLLLSNDNFWCAREFKQKYSENWEQNNFYIIHLLCSKPCIFTWERIALFYFYARSLCTFSPA